MDKCCVPQNISTKYYELAKSHILLRALYTGSGQVLPKQKSNREKTKCDCHVVVSPQNYLNFFIIMQCTKTTIQILVLLTCTAWLHSSQVQRNSPTPGTPQSCTYPPGQDSNPEKLLKHISACILPPFIPCMVQCNSARIDGHHNPCQLVARTVQIMENLGTSHATLCLS